MMNHYRNTTTSRQGRKIQTVAADCLSCGAHKPVKIPAAVWEAWKVGEITTERAFITLDVSERRWVANGMCPDCWANAVCHDETTAYFETQCPGCQRWESFGVPQAALLAYRAGELTDRQAFPHHNDDERNMIELGWHGACFDNAAQRPNDGTNGRPIL